VWAVASLVRAADQPPFARPGRLEWQPIVGRCYRKPTTSLGKPKRRHITHDNLNLGHA
jgi:hypothetical protein